MAAAETAAKFFIMLANQRDDDFITNLKLNKLLYYAQGAYLARTGRPLFNEQIEAWAYGPVVPSIYRKYKVCGKNPIPFVEEDSVKTRDFTEEELDALLDAAREFGRYTGNALVGMTHEPGTPWSAVYDGSRAAIPEDLIYDYFTANPVPKFQAGNRSERVSELPKDWYDPAEDAEWEGYL